MNCCCGHVADDHVGHTHWCMVDGCSCDFFEWDGEEDE